MGYPTIDRRQFMVGTSTAALAMAFAPGAAWAQTSGDAELIALMDRAFNLSMITSPQSMTSLGLDTGTYSYMRSRLDQVGEAAEDMNERLARRELAALNAISESSLSETGKVRQGITRFMLEQQLLSDGLKVPFVGAPYRLSQQDGAYFDIPDFLNS